MIRPVHLVLVSLTALACGGDSAPAAGAGGGQQGGAGGNAAGGDMTGGGGSATGGGSASGGAGGEGGANPLCETLSDDFDDAATLDCWTLRHEHEGESPQYDLLAVNGTVPGHFVVRPTSSGWFEDDAGTLLFKTIEGDFVVETHAAAVAEDDDTQPPSGAFHTAGLLARDPASVAGDQNWLMYNVGQQEAFVGTEGKTTVQSASVLTLLPGTHSGRLRICRLGGTFHMLRQLDDETEWTLEHSYDRDDLPAELQVGLITNAWPPGDAEPRDIEARFDYLHVGAVADMAGCTAAIDAR